jgi:hypothetical protein
MTDHRSLVAEARAAGWTVAVHNDYALNGHAHTFWLWTHPDGRYVKGEGRTDAEALALCFPHLADALDAPPATPSAEEIAEIIHGDPKPTCGQRGVWEKWDHALGKADQILSLLSHRGQR